MTSRSKPWIKSKRTYLYPSLLILTLHGQAHALPPASKNTNTGLLPFATATHTYDSNLLNRSDNGPGPAPQSDQINRFEIGTLINFQLSRQKFSGALSLSDTKHSDFKERNTNGRAHRLRWDSEIGNTLIGSLEASSVSDQAPIQTGPVTAVKRDQDNGNVSLTWKFHPNYSMLNLYSKTNTRFEGIDENSNEVISGLDRDDELSYVGLEYHPSTGNSLAILLKESHGHFPTRQIIAPGQSVSNDFDQNETELLGKWNLSDITAMTVSLSSVQRDHDELQSRDYSGTNYRLEVLYKPSLKTHFNLSWGKQIVGVSDATNSDALARQLFLAMNMRLTEKVVLKLAYRPQNLQFDGTDGLGGTPRTERLKEGGASLEYQLYDRVSLGADYRNRSRTTTQSNADYSANSISVFLKFEH